MKATISNLTHYTICQNRAVFSGQGGSLLLALYEPGVLRVSYSFDGYAVGDPLEKASAYMTQERPFAPWTGDVTETETEFRISFSDGLSVLLEKRCGIVSLLRGETLLHGGAIGSADLVIPEYPVRLICDTAHAYARFNFPIKEGDEFFGLGDKSGYPDRRGRRFAMFNRDSLGYDASNSDPLYKSVPFFLKVNPSQGVCLGVVFPQPCVKTVDFGRESPYYYSVEAEGGPFDYVLLTGEAYSDVLSAYARLTGLPALPPLYSFGYLGSSMNYVEPDDAAERVLAFFARTEKEDIPCEGMYFSSGYLKAPDGKRYALLWNQQKFPHYGAYLEALKNRGYHLIMNIKPGILTSHPWYDQLKDKGYLIRDEEGQTYVEYFWGGGASFVDFDNPDACAWWKEQLKEQYLRHGCAGIWNDNNELELEDTELPAYRTRSLYPVRMSEAAYAACREYSPEKRPWIYSRAGTIGLQRFARTWTGDNTSTFLALRFNQYMGLGLGLSGLPLYGHDLGGFFGDFPEEELLLRSCETAVFQSRFVIHSWRENGIPTEPWSYPTALPLIRSLIQAHYRMMPYLYNCAIHASQTGCPVERMLHLEYPRDPALSSRDGNTLFGPFVLKAQALDKGITHVPVRLPEGEGWYEPRSSLLHDGGKTLDLPVPMDGAPHYLLRQGAVFPTTPAAAQLTTAVFAETEFLLLPNKPGRVTAWQHYEDDGETEWNLRRYNHYCVTLTDRQVTVERILHNAPASNTPRKHTLRLPKGFRFVENGLPCYEYNPDATLFCTPLCLAIEGDWPEA